MAVTPISNEVASNRKIKLTLEQVQYLKSHAEGEAKTEDQQLEEVRVFYGLNKDTPKAELKKHLDEFKKAREAFEKVTTSKGYYNHLAIEGLRGILAEKDNGALLKKLAEAEAKGDLKAAARYYAMAVNKEALDNASKATPQATLKGALSKAEDALKHLLGPVNLPKLTLVNLVQVAKDAKKGKLMLFTYYDATNKLLIKVAVQVDGAGKVLEQIAHIIPGVEHKSTDAMLLFEIVPKRNP